MVNDFWEESMWNSEDQQHSEVAMDNAEAYIELYKQLEHFAMGNFCKAKPWV